MLFLGYNGCWEQWSQGLALLPADILTTPVTRLHNTPVRNRLINLLTCCGWRSQMMVLILFRISSMKGITSPTCTWMKWRLHFWAILMNVSQAMSWTPSWVSEEGSFQFRRIRQAELSRFRRGGEFSSLTVHELKEFVDHRFEKLPMCSEKTWILANNIHDVGGYDGLVVLSSLLLTQTQQVLRKTDGKTSVGRWKRSFLFTPVVQYYLLTDRRKH